LKKDHIHLNFLVIRYHTKILKAKSLSNLLSNLPSISNNWVYLSPEYELLFINKLNSFD